MARIPGHRLLHSPGPTHIPDAVLAAMHRQSMDLADPRVDEILDDCLTGLARVLRTREAAVTLFAGNGHGAWEAAIQNLIAPGQAILIPGTGHFSESWAMQAEGLGHEVIRLPWREGHPISPDEVESALRADTARNIAAVFIVHTDTSTSVTSDLAAIRAAMNASGHPALMVVDVVASLAAAPFAMDDLGVNAVVGGSQKGLMLPPGLAFMASDALANERMQANPAPRFYWDWQRRQGKLSYQKFCGTPPEHLLFGLQAALRLLLDEEGLEQVIARHALLAGAVQTAVARWAEAGAVDFFCKVPDCRSVSVTAIATTREIDPEALRTVAREKFQVAIAGGNGPTIGRAFRIGHLGDMNPAMILGCLAGVEGAMRVQRVPFGEAGVSSAIEYLAARV